jgi:hypothetical protein
MDRAGKRHPLRHVWFEEWLVTLGHRLCSAIDDIINEYYYYASITSPYTCGTSLQLENEHLEAAPS